ncbi:MAG: ABC transporter permease, partial [Candidatus Hydrogenedentes bacterium]|nr:ABC transporter permease [Candidatus Hydrogenedentota bacterium]
MMMQRLNLARNVQLGVKNLLLHKLRSFLTMLGIVFGVASVIAMLSIGEGASKEALEQIRKLGSTNVIINSVKPQEDQQQSSARSYMSVYGLTYDDEIRVRESYGAVTQTVPMKLVRQQGRLQARELELRVVGTSPNWIDLVQRPILAGRYLAPRDVQESANVVVLTEYGARRLLATQNTIGQALRIGRYYYEVIGIIKSESGQGGGIQTPDQEVDAYIPINVARARYGDVNARRTSGSREMERVELHQLIVQV